MIFYENKECLVTSFDPIFFYSQIAPLGKCIFMFLSCIVINWFGQGNQCTSIDSKAKLSFPSIYKTCRISKAWKLKGRAVILLNLSQKDSREDNLPNDKGSWEIWCWNLFSMFAAILWPFAILWRHKLHLMGVLLPVCSWVPQCLQLLKEKLWVALSYWISPKCWHLVLM